MDHSGGYCIASMPPPGLSTKASDFAWSYKEVHPTVCWENVYHYVQDLPCMYVQVTCRATQNM